MRQGNRDVVRALHLARQDTSVLSAQAARKNGTVLSGQGEVRQAPAARAQVPKVTVRGWDPKAARTEVRAAVRENRAKVAQAVRNVRAAIRDAVRHRADAEA